MTEEDEEQFRRESAPRKYTLRQRWANHRAEVKARRPKGARARARAPLADLSSLAAASAAAASSGVGSGSGGSFSVTISTAP